MKKLKTLTLALTLFISSITIISANNVFVEDVNINGSWDMTADFNGQSIPAKLTIKQSEKTFTGTFTTAMGLGDLKNGKIDGNKITADVAVDAQGQTFDFKLTGKYEKGKISGSMDGSGFSIGFTAEKAKEEKKK